MKLAKTNNLPLDQFINIADIDKVDLRNIIDKSIKNYTRDVRTRKFPAIKNVYK